MGSIAICKGAHKPFREGGGRRRRKDFVCCRRLLVTKSPSFLRFFFFFFLALSPFTYQGSRTLPSNATENFSTAQYLW